MAVSNLGTGSLGIGGLAVSGLGIGGLGIGGLASTFSGSASTVSPSEGSHRRLGIDGLAVSGPQPMRRVIKQTPGTV